MGIQMDLAAISVYDRGTGWQTLAAAFPRLDRTTKVIAYLDPSVESGTLSIRQGDYKLRFPPLQWKWARETDSVADRFMRLPQNAS